MKVALTTLFLFVELLLAPAAAHAEKFVFVINTTAEDEMGPATAAYIDETRWAKQWKDALKENGQMTAGDDVKVMPIRANSNHELTRALVMWMTPLPTDTGPREVLGLGIYSHGEPMILRNDSEKFKLRLPTDIGQVFAPIIGHFAKGARIVLMGCLVLDGQSELTAAHSLQSLADSFGLTNGLVYANATRGFDLQTLVADPLNSDIKSMKRAAIVVSYLMWPVTAIVMPALSRYYLNHGYALLRTDHDRVFPTRFDPAISKTSW